jgi:hypothetical protein
MRMARTFEELAVESLDALYRGALFLAAGDHPEAERLLIDSITLAHGEQEGSRHPDAERWLEGRMVRCFLSGASGGQPTSDRRPPKRPRPRSADPWNVGPETLFAAAGALPHRPRAALWLVLIRRWSYADAERVMGVDDEGLRDLLRYRDLLLREVLRSTPGSDPSIGRTATGEG